MNRQTATQTHEQKPPTTLSASGLLQRQCACGNHTVAGNECMECGKTKRFSLQTKLKISKPEDVYEREADRIANQVIAAPAHPAINSESPRIQCFSGQQTGQADTAPASVGQALASPSRPLDPALRQDMGQRFAYDFSRVRVHTGPKAAQAAAAVEAEAYTVGHHIVFGADRYRPDSRDGRKLLAHELTHVVQHTRTLAAPGVVSRRSFFEKAAIFLGLSEGNFDDKELLDYLAAVEKANKIEDHYDSDNKAREIVRRWMAGQPRFRLTANQMVLLIHEMDTGHVGSEDQTGIFDILSHAENGDLRIIFGPGGISPQQIESDFGGERKRRLLLFYDARFRGGKAALYGGTVDPVSGPGPGTPRFDWDWSFFRERIDNPAYRDDELAAQITALPEAQRSQALKDVGERRNVLQKAFNELTDKIDAEPDPVKRATLESGLRDLARRRQRYDAILQPAFRDIVLAEPPATLLPKTRLPTAVEKVEIAKALKPDLRLGVGGAPLPFVEHIPGEPKRYGEKISDYMPPMVAEYYAQMVAGKGPAEHADPTKTHKLDEFDSIANAAKVATDSIFGTYKTGPAFRSDRPPPIGRGQLHDLFADTQARLAVMSPAAKRRMAKDLLMYFFQSDRTIGGFNRKHNADPKFNPAGLPLNTEATILNTIANGWVGSAPHVRELNEIDRNWDASADPTTHEVNIQIFKKSTPAEDRMFLWDMYQTLIHEYIHTLAHHDYVTFADGFGPSQENNTLIEGVDSFLTEIVWSKAKTQTADPAVRTKVEGAAYSGEPFDASVIPPVYNRRYDSYAQAVKLVNVMGVRNLYAAYFLGKVDLIKIP